MHLSRGTLQSLWSFGEASASFFDTLGERMGILVGAVISTAGFNCGPKALFTRQTVLRACMFTYL
jgi:hypothetical protein